MNSYGHRPSRQCNNVNRLDRFSSNEKVPSLTSWSDLFLTECWHVTPCSSPLKWFSRSFLDNQSEYGLGFFLWGPIRMICPLNKQLSAQRVSPAYNH
jgi:hypothetical protein